MLSGDGAAADVASSRGEGLGVGVAKLIAVGVCVDAAVAGCAVFSRVGAGVLVGAFADETSVGVGFSIPDPSREEERTPHTSSNPSAGGMSETLSASPLPQTHACISPFLTWVAAAPSAASRHWFCAVRSKNVQYVQLAPSVWHWQKQSAEFEQPVPLMLHTATPMLLGCTTSGKPDRLSNSYPLMCGSAKATHFEPTLPLAYCTTTPA